MRLSGGFLGRTYAHGEGSAKVVEGYPGTGIAGVVHGGWEVRGFLRGRW